MNEVIFQRGNLSFPRPLEASMLKIWSYLLNSCEAIDSIVNIGGRLDKYTKAATLKTKVIKRFPNASLAHGIRAGDLQKGS